MPEPRIILVPVVESTNDEARRRAAAGETPPFWVRAERQTAGRGRRGRSWVGLAGNLFITGLYHLACPPAEAAQLSFAAGLAAAEVLDAQLDPARVTLKWPNDVLIDSVKAAGVLLEAAPAGRGLELLVGVGINLAHAPKLEDGASASALGDVVDRDPAPPDLAGRRLVAAFERWRAIWAADGFAPIRAAWLARAAGLGGPVEAQLGGTRLKGIFEDLDEDGALVLAAPQGRVRVRAGDVFFSGPDGVG